MITDKMFYCDFTEGELFFYIWYIRVTLQINIICNLGPLSIVLINDVCPSVSSVQMHTCL